MKRKSPTRRHLKKRGKSSSTSRLVHNDTQSPPSQEETQSFYQNTSNCFNEQLGCSPQYRFGFTNSEFFLFLATLTPLELVTVETALSILIQLNLNAIETRLVGSFILEVGVTIGNIAVQERLQESLGHEQLNRSTTQLDDRVKELEDTLAKLTKQLNQLQEQQQLSQKNHN